MDSELARSLEDAAEAIDIADALLISAGAGMGVDSGLPDFRGAEGFWNAYPPLRERNLSFVDLANPVWFQRDPEQAWGFYGHRLNLYLDTAPHQGFDILRRWAAGKPGGYFVFTSNVDGQFQKAGFQDERILECHGSIHVLQCAGPCCKDIWPVESPRINVDATTVRAKGPLPVCPRCQNVARPNILMFGDWNWVGRRTQAQEHSFRHWLQTTDRNRLVVVECGAGTSVPTVRAESERVAGTLIRINPRHWQVPDKGISLRCGALEALTRIDAMLGS